MARGTKASPAFTAAWGTKASPAVTAARGTKRLQHLQQHGAPTCPGFSSISRVYRHGILSPAPAQGGGLRPRDAAAGGQLRRLTKHCLGQPPARSEVWSRLGRVSTQISRWLGPL